MSETRLGAAVCHCRSFQCGQQRFRDKEGNWQSGALVSRSAHRNHQAADNLIVARFGGAQDSDNEGSDKESSVSQIVSEMDVDQHSSRASSGIGISNSYDCSAYHNLTFEKGEAAVLHVSLLTAMLAVFDHTSFATSGWLLKSAKGLLTLAASGGLGEPRTQNLSFRQEQTLNTLPVDIRTVLKWMQIDPKLVTVMCCRSCFAMYPIPQPTSSDGASEGRPDSPQGLRRCINQSFPNPETPGDDQETPGGNQETPGGNQETPGNDNSWSLEANACGEELFRPGKNGDLPIKKYAYQNLYDWLARLFSRPGTEAGLEQSARLANIPFDPNHQATDIQHSKIWKQFIGPDGKQYTNQAGNLTFGLFMDAINPYGNKQAGKHASITFMIMTCYSLPLDLRYKPQNLFVVGIAPGPKEPSLEQINWVLRPIVEQLKVLWSTGLVLSQTCLYPQGRQVHAAILPFFADLPALRRGLGFAAPTATRMCSRCLLKKSEITNLQPETWPLRTLSDHKARAIESRDAATLKIREQILQAHGVRYSVMLELPYWDIIKYHVVDPMHNLLLGLLKWHCQRFWAMTDVAQEPEPKGTAQREIRDLERDATRPTFPAGRPASPTESEDEGSGIPFNRMEFRSTESSDNSFSPNLEAEGWDTGPWTPPAEDKVILDGEALAFVNKLLPRIHIPTWIKRALPILGKASFGSLKADEWRNLFTIQLPLVLPVYWAVGGPLARSLFRNFAHLVSMTNLALKRSMCANRVQKYREHTLEYLRSCLILFPHTTLAPNHHMSVHVADGLESFGPSRAWWSFSMERLMGTILKASHNNRIGELEITFLTNFCRFGNLEALLSRPEKFPPKLRPFIEQLRAFHDPPIATKAPTIPKSHEGFLDSLTLKILAKRLNDLFPCSTGATWVPSNVWAKKKQAESKEFLPVNSRIERLSSFVVDGIMYSTFKENPNNSVIALRPDVAPQYGIIDQIFTHRRTLGDRTSAADTWLLIQPLRPCTFSSPFAGLSKFSMQVELRTIESGILYVSHTQDIRAHCAWIKYRSSEILPTIKTECIAIVSLDR